MKCIQCGKEMNPVEAILGAVCGKCCRENHQKVAGRRRRVIGRLRPYEEPPEPEVFDGTPGL